MRMCSFDDRSRANTGAIPSEETKRAWKDQLDGCWSLDARNGDHTSRLAEYGPRVENRSRNARSEKPLARPNGTSRRARGWTKEKAECIGESQTSPLILEGEECLVENLTWAWTGR
jgi:hypothetical protein